MKTIRNHGSIHMRFVLGEKMMKTKPEVKRLTRMSSRQQTEREDPHGPQVLLAQT